jgi:hypothetical protein
VAVPSSQRVVRFQLATDAFFVEPVFGFEPEMPFPASVTGDEPVPLQLGLKVSRVAWITDRGTEAYEGDFINLCSGREATFPARLKWNHFFMVAKNRQIIYRLRPQIKRLKLIAFSCCRVLRRAR